MLIFKSLQSNFFAISKKRKNWTILCNEYYQNVDGITRKGDK